MILAPKQYNEPYSFSHHFSLRRFSPVLSKSETPYFGFSLSLITFEAKEVLCLPTKTQLNLTSIPKTNWAVIEFSYSKVLKVPSYPSTNLFWIRGLSLLANFFQLNNSNVNCVGTPILN